MSDIVPNGPKNLKGQTTDSPDRQQRRPTGSDQVKNPSDTTSPSAVAETLSRELPTSHFPQPGRSAVDAREAHKMIQSAQGVESVTTRLPLADGGPIRVRTLGDTARGGDQAPDRRAARQNTTGNAADIADRPGADTLADARRHNINRAPEATTVQTQVDLRKGTNPHDVANPGDRRPDRQNNRPEAPAGQDPSDGRRSTRQPEIADGVNRPGREGRALNTADRPEGRRSTRQVSDAGTDGHGPDSSFTVRRNNNTDQGVNPGRRNATIRQLADGTAHIDRSPTGRGRTAPGPEAPDANGRRSRTPENSFTKRPGQDGNAPTTDRHTGRRVDTSIRPGEPTPIARRSAEALSTNPNLTPRQQRRLEQLANPGQPGTRRPEQPLPADMVTPAQHRRAERIINAPPLVQPVTDSGGGGGRKPGRTPGAEPIDPTSGRAGRRDFSPPPGESTRGRRDTPTTAPRPDATRPDGSGRRPGDVQPDGRPRVQPISGFEQPTRTDTRRETRPGRGSEVPLNNDQRRWVNDQARALQNDRSERAGQNFKDNFEKLSPQNRDTLIRMDGRQQQEVIGRMSQDRPNRPDRPGEAPDARKDVRTRVDATIPGLDMNNPQSHRFLNDAVRRLDQLRAEPALANTKISDVLKGFDPNSVRALENFLAHHQGLEPGQLTLGQLDKSQLKMLHDILKGKFDQPGGPLKLTPVEALGEISRRVRNPFGTPEVLNPLTAPDGISKPGFRPGPLADGYTPFVNPLSEIGKVLNNSESGTKLSDLVGRNLDPLPTALINSGTLALVEFTAKLSPLQELNVINMLDQSPRLTQLLDGGDAIAKAGGFANILGTAFGDSRGDFTVRGDLPITASSFISDGANAAQDATTQALKQQEYVANLPIDASTGMPYDPSTGKLIDPVTGRPIGDKPIEKSKGDGEGEDMDDKNDKKKHKQKDDSDIDEEKAKHKAMLLLIQARKKREQEIRDKAKKDQQKKEEDEKRVKYICKDGDTVQSIALKQLRDSRVAPLIYQINKDVIPTQEVNGQKVPMLHAGLIIWLPSPKETREFRAKLMSGPGSALGIAGGGEPGRSMTAEEELEAKFGGSWSGSGQAGAPDSVERKLMEDAVAEARRRRENIEKALGPITPSTGRTRAPGERLNYTVRLGDTLRSVATKHPSILDVNLWRLLAELNELSTEVDAKGHPKTGLVRGSTIKIPTLQEIAEYKQRTGLTTHAMKQEDRVKTCRKCGRMNAAPATMCLTCGHEFETAADTSEAKRPPTTTPKDAATIVLEALGNEQRHDQSRTEDLDAIQAQTGPSPLQGPDTRDLEKSRSNPPVPPIGPWDGWASTTVLEETCRLVKSTDSFDQEIDKMIIQLQIKEDNSDWFPILEYEVFGSHSIRHSYSRQGRSRKSVKIDLPAQAAMELAQNDLIANWTSYKQKYLS